MRKKEKEEKVTEHPEATQYGQFHESKQFAADDQQVVLVDIDETICFYPDKRQYDLAEPHKSNIAKINKLYDEGWKAIKLRLHHESLEDDIKTVQTVKDAVGDKMTIMVDANQQWSVDQAIKHINEYGSSHTDSIVTKNRKTAKPCGATQCSNPSIELLR